MGTLIGTITQHLGQYRKRVFHLTYCIKKERGASYIVHKDPPLKINIPRWRSAVTPPLSLECRMARNNKNKEKRNGSIIQADGRIFRLSMPLSSSFQGARKVSLPLSSVLQIGKLVCPIGKRDDPIEKWVSPTRKMLAQ